MDELEKYRTIYSHPERWGRYGHSNHGAKALPLVEGAPSLVDVGCGHNEFVQACRSNGTEAVGVDFACPSADIIAPAQALPFTDKQFAVLTAFDMLEHLRPEDVRAVLAEFARVSERFVFSISYVPSVNKVARETLHPTVRPEAWWRDRIAEAGGVSAKQGNYLHGIWGPPKAPPVLPGETCILVGNGPSLMHGELGTRIDAHEQVVRFNNYHTVKFERHTGSKTTLWSTFGKGYMPGEGEAAPERIIFINSGHGGPAIEGKEVWKLPYDIFTGLRQRVLEVSQRDDEGKAKTIPSSGIQVAAWLLEWIEIDKPLSITGFDHFQKSPVKGSDLNHHHYWHTSSSKRPPEHDGDAEAIIFNQWIAEGRVIPLTSNL